MKNERDTEKLFTPNYILLIVTAFIGGFLMTFFVSTLPLYAERMTGSTVYAGLVTSIFTVAALISRPLTGVACEKMHHVKLLIIGFTVMTAACISYGITSGITIFLILRAVHGAGFGIKTTVSGVIVAESIPKKRFAEGIGIYNLYMPLTSALGPAVAYTVIGDGHDSTKFNLLFFIGAGLGVVAIVLSFFIQSNADDVGEKKENELCESGELPKTFLGFEKGVVWPAIVLALMYIGQGAVMSFIALYAIDSGIGGAGEFFVVNAAALFFARFIFAKTVKYIGYDIPVVAGLVIFGAGLFAAPFTNSIHSLYLVAIMLGSAQGMVPMAINAIILERCSKQRTGTAMAAYTSSMDIGIGLGSIVLGAILEVSGFHCIFTIGAALSFVGTGIYLLKLNGKKKEV